MFLYLERVFNGAQRLQKIGVCICVVLIVVLCQQERTGNVFNCVGSGQCQYDTIVCDPFRDCTVTCSGTQACKDTIIHCPESGTCVVDCQNGLAATDVETCAGANIYAVSSSMLRLSCSESVLDSCDHISVYCPDNGHGGPISCILDPITFNSVSNGIDIYAVEGFNDFQVIATEINEAIIHCGDAYQTACELRENTLLCPQCMNILSPSQAPSFAPTSTPTVSPTTASPSSAPSATPTLSPTSSPTTARPTWLPSASPTMKPTLLPSSLPSLAPSTSHPTVTPTISPTISPTRFPTSDPSISPTLKPSAPPTRSPSLSPTSVPPTMFPTLSPTSRPTAKPTAKPTVLSTSYPTPYPTPYPTMRPHLHASTSAPPTLIPTRLQILDGIVMEEEDEEEGEGTTAAPIPNVSLYREQKTVNIVVVFASICVSVFFAVVGVRAFAKYKQKDRQLKSIVLQANMHRQQPRQQQHGTFDSNGNAASVHGEVGGECSSDVGEGGHGHGHGHGQQFAFQRLPTVSQVLIHPHPLMTELEPGSPAYEYHEADISNLRRLQLAHMNLNYQPVPVVGSVTPNVLNSPSVVHVYAYDDNSNIPLPHNLQVPGELHHNKNRLQSDARSHSEAHSVHEPSESRSSSNLYGGGKPTNSFNAADTKRGVIVSAIRHGDGQATDDSFSESDSSLNLKSNAATTKTNGSRYRNIYQNDDDDDDDDEDDDDHEHENFIHVDVNLDNDQPPNDWNDDGDGEAMSLHAHTTVTLSVYQSEYALPAKRTEDLETDAASE